MNVHRLEQMTRGWFVGDFAPTLYRTGAVEVGIKHYAAGDREARHLHRIATELTAVVAGRVAMDGRELQAGDIVVLEPGEASDFVALTDATVVAVKLPGAPDDKYLAEDRPC
jgi:quercetin dioxygenase-like cupin family protein